jgi:hypothetical protein
LKGILHAKPFTNLPRAAFDRILYGMQTKMGVFIYNQ